MVRTTLYADYAAIFVKTIKNDINFLASTLEKFSDATGLVMNCAKSQVVQLVVMESTLMTFCKSSRPLESTSKCVTLAFRYR
jgi:hypothetical protein